MKSRYHDELLSRGLTPNSTEWKKELKNLSDKTYYRSNREEIARKTKESRKKIPHKARILVTGPLILPQGAKSFERIFDD